MKKILFAFAISAALVSCSSGGGSKKATWSDADKTSFSTECVNGASAAMGADGAQKYCDCMLQKLMDKYPKAEDVGAVNMDEMSAMAQECI